MSSAVAPTALTYNERASAKIRLYTRHFGEPWGAYWVHNMPEAART